MSDGAFARTFYARGTKLPTTFFAPVFLLVFSIVILGVSGCRVPVDPNDTLDQVQGGTLRVGLTHNPPWTSSGGKSGDGIEMRLVRELAEELDAQIEWRYGPEHELMTALEHFELDLVMGGFTKPNPWEKHVALSRPYFESSLVIAVANTSRAAGGPFESDDLKGMRIAVHPDTPSGAYVRAQGGIPVPLHEAEAATLPLAVPDWRVAALGLKPVFKLQKLQHVMALPPGENRWIVFVERFLHKKKNGISALANDVVEQAGKSGVQQ